MDNWSCPSNIFELIIERFRTRKRNLLGSNENPAIIEDKLAQGADKAKKRSEVTSKVEN